MISASIGRRLHRSSRDGRYTTGRPTIYVSTHRRSFAQRLPRLPSLPDWAAAGVVLGLAVLAAYANSFGVPFLFDDRWNIVENPSVHRLWPLADVLRGWDDSGIAGRPLVNLSFALNYAVSGTRVWSYHLVNILIHLGSGLALYGILRRTFDGRVLAGRYGAAAHGLALAAALLFAVHPMQTQAVTYITQRLESLMGLCFLLTLYCAVRGWQSPGRRTVWHLLAAAAFAAGAGAKEVIVAAPLVVCLYDRFFVHDSFKAVFRRSPWLYAGFLPGLVLLLVLVLSGRTAQWAYAGGRLMTPLQYLLVQPLVIVHYLRLSLWPAGFCFDYGFPGDNPYWWGQFPVWPAAAALAGVSLAAAAVFLAALRRRPAAFPGIWFFLILAPTSSILPLYCIAAEQRMYLPLAAVAAAAVLAADALRRRLAAALPSRRKLVLKSAAALAAGAAVLLTGLTVQRNRDFSDRLSIWTDTAAKAPGNPRALQNLGTARVDAGRIAEAIAAYRAAVRLTPDNPGLLANLAVALDRSGQPRQAALNYRRVLEYDPQNATAHSNLGVILAGQGRLAEAKEHFRQAVRIRPDYAEAHNNLGYALLLQGRTGAAASHFRRAMEIRPDFSAARNNLERLRQEAGRPEP